MNNTLAVVGMLDKLLQAHRDGLDLNQFLLDESIRKSETLDNEDEEEDDWTGDLGGFFLRPM